MIQIQEYQARFFGFKPIKVIPKIKQIKKFPKNPEESYKKEKLRFEKKLDPLLEPERKI